jgi:hypothetical protein
MYDNFEAFQRLDITGFDFNFSSMSYEIWENGRKINYASALSSISLTTEKHLGKDIAIIRISNSNLNKYLSLKCEFDIFMTSNDRLQLFILPNMTNVKNNLAFKMFNENFGPTREFKMFENNEPFCCNLFTIDGKLDKVTFNIAEPERMIEFYSY